MAARPPPPATVRREDRAAVWDVIELLFFAYRDFVSDPDDALAKFSFGRAHHRVLHFVNRNPGMKVAELLDILKITKQSLGRVLKQLIDQGYVLQKEGASDRRQRLLYVTPKGEALAMKLAGAAVRPHRARPVRARAERPRRRLPVPGRHDRRRQSRRRAAVHRARRPRAPATRMILKSCDFSDKIMRSVEGRPVHALEGSRAMRAIKTESAVPADDAPHLLIVDDDRRIRALLSRFLVAEGYRVTTAESAAEARAKLAGLRFDLMILDVMMPGETGFEFARSLRASSSVPILMLTARDEPVSRIEGLEIGADDYVGKPFEPRELSLRVANILKRASPPAAPAAESVRFGDFVFHLARGELRRGEEIIRLTDREREMMRVLAACPGETVPRLALAGNGGSIGERAVDVQVNRLRRKIERDPANPLFVQTVRGIGYRLVTTP